MLADAGGDWSVVEVNLTKSNLKRKENNVSGKYVTAIDLEAKGWTASMIENSKEWAKARGVYREKSAVHGAEEWQLPLEEAFNDLTRHDELWESNTGTHVEARISKAH